MLLDPKSREKLLRAMVRPLARFCISRSIALAEILEALKQELVDAAKAEIDRHNSKVTVSKVATITGITRREVDRIMQGPAELSVAPSLCARVLGQWENDRRFSTKAGKAKILSFGYDASEFSKLVRTVSQDTNPSSMLFELQRLGAVEVVRNGIRLVSTESYYRPAPEKAVNLIFRNVQSLVESGEQNLEESQETRNLFLRTEFDDISRRDLPKIRKWVLKAGTDFHRQVREYLAQFDRELNPSAGRSSPEDRVSIAVGSFSLASEPDRIGKGES